jgi:hypothetical protein
LFTYKKAIIRPGIREHKGEDNFLAKNQTSPLVTKRAKCSNERSKVRSARSGKKQAGSSRLRR